MTNMLKPRQNSFFVSLAQHLEENYKSPKSLTLVNKVPTFTASPSITVSQEIHRTDAITVTQKDTGRTNAQERQDGAAPQDSSKPVKYNVLDYDIYDYESEYEKDFPSYDFKVDNLKKHLHFWKSVLKANDFVLNVINSGYLIPFFKNPTSAYLKNNKSTLTHTSFVNTAIESLLHTGVIIECQGHIPFVVNPLSVSVNSNGKERLILDLRHVNKFTEKRRFKFEGVPEALQYVIKDGFLIKFDLKSGYHHITIHEDHQQYLGFAWHFPDGIKHFIFKCLPFGLSTAGHVFSKVLRPLVKYWRSDGLKMIVYLDDGWGTAANFDICSKMSSRVKYDLISAGFFINNDKSIWFPTRTLTWLGFIWNLEKSRLEIPSEKIKSFKYDVFQTFKNLSTITARKMARITGKIISFSPSFGNICRIMTRNMMMLINTSDFWDQKICLNEKVNLELKFWLNNCDSLPNKAFFTKHFLPDKIVYTDASGFACAGFTVQSKRHVVHKMWTPDEATQSSTYRELKAVLITLMSLCEDFSHRLIKIYTDNQNVIRIVDAGSMKPELQEMSLKIFNFCIKHGISLEVEWVPRELNQTADYYSKLFDYNDWKVSDFHFHFFYSKWGPFDIDLFADVNNHKLEKFYSAYWCPGTSGVDAFAFDWFPFNCWIVPPIHLISRVIVYLKLCKGNGTLVIPKWTSACFWPLLWSAEHDTFVSFVKDYVEYCKPTGFYEAGSDKNSLFAKDKLTFNVLVLKIDCR